MVAGVAKMSFREVPLRAKVELEPWPLGSGKEVTYKVVTIRGKTQNVCHDVSEDTIDCSRNNLWTIFSSRGAWSICCTARHCNIL